MRFEESTPLLVHFLTMVNVAPKSKELTSSNINQGVLKPFWHHAGRMVPSQYGDTRSGNHGWHPSKTYYTAVPYAGFGTFWNYRTAVI